MYRHHRPVPIPSMPRGCTDISTMRQHSNNGELRSFLLSLTCFCTQVPSTHVGMHDPPLSQSACAPAQHTCVPHAYMPTHSPTHPPAYPPAPPLTHLLIPLSTHLSCPFSCPFSHSPTHSPILPLIRPFSHSFAHLTGGGATPSTGNGGTTPSG